MKIFVSAMNSFFYLPGTIHTFHNSKAMRNTLTQIAFHTKLHTWGTRQSSGTVEGSISLTMAMEWHRLSMRTLWTSDDRQSCSYLKCRLNKYDPLINIINGIIFSINGAGDKFSIISMDWEKTNKKVSRL